MKASRGMGDINPSKMPKGKKIVRKDKPQDVEMYKKGGKVKMPSTPKAPKGKKLAEGGNVNAAGNYTKPEVRKRIVSAVKAEATHGTGAGQWSARKSQLVAKRYKAAGGGYRD
jgi:hypothetical protein